MNAQASGSSHAWVIGSYLWSWHCAHCTVSPRTALPIASMRSNSASMRNCSGSAPPSSLAIEFRRKPVATLCGCPCARQQVARHLLDHEPVVRHVLVERLHDPVAVCPYLSGPVLLVAVRVGVASRVKPCAPPSLSVVRGGEQTVHQPLVVPRVVVREEGVQFPGRRWDSCEIEAGPAYERFLAGAWRRLHASRLHTGQYEAVDRILDPCLVADCRRPLPLGRRVGPVRGQSRLRRAILGPGRTLLDPSTDEGNLLRGQPAPHRHSLAGAQTGHPAIELAPFRVARHDPAAVRALPERGLSIVEP